MAENILGHKIVEGKDGAMKRCFQVHTANGEPRGGLFYKKSEAIAHMKKCNEAEHATEKK